MAVRGMVGDERRTDYEITGGLYSGIPSETAIVCVEETEKVAMIRVARSRLQYTSGPVEER